jgi:hypothetical protein
MAALFINATLEFFGRSPTGRAIRCNLFFAAGATQKNISAAIPNAKRVAFFLNGRASYQI